MVNPKLFDSSDDDNEDLEPHNIISNLSNNKDIVEIQPISSSEQKMMVIDSNSIITIDNNNITVKDDSNRRKSIEKQSLKKQSSALQNWLNGPIVNSEVKDKKKDMEIVEETVIVFPESPEKSENKKDILSITQIPISNNSKIEISTEKRDSFVVSDDGLESPIKPKPKKRRKAKINFSSDEESDSPAIIEENEDEDEISINSDDSDAITPNRFMDPGFVPKSMNESMLAFFNSATSQEIIDVISCTEEIAKIVIQLRPYTSVDMMESVFQEHKKKKMLATLPDKYEEQMEGYLEVDNLVEQCEKYGNEVMAILKRWTRNNHSLGGFNPSAKEEDNEDEEKDCPEVTLVSVDESAGEEDDSEEALSKNDGTKCLKKQPSIVNPNLTLKSYQLVGISWLNMLHSKGFGGILADQMGLGKTAQVISFLGYLKMQGKKGPHLIIVPSSTLENWVRECAKWCPSLYVRTYYGSQKERSDLQEELFSIRNKIDIIITTYNLATGNKDDRIFIRKYGFKSMILDEGHMVKNMNSARYKHLMSFQTQFRLLLTGTPLQNTLMELLALLTFIMPDLFAKNAESFELIFRIKSTQKRNVLSSSRIDRASRIMAPFVLRRRKDHVHSEMPKKYVDIVRCDATERQSNIYKSIIEDSRSEFLSTNDENDTNSGKGDAKKLSNIMMQLRKAADHPLLFRRLYKDDTLKKMARDIMNEVEYVHANQDYIFEDMQWMSDFELHRLCMKFKYIQKYALKDESIFMDCGKVKWLESNLPKMKEAGDKILIFSQFVIMLDVLEKVMKLMGIKYVRLDGSTAVAERQLLIDQYNDNEEITVFLLSTKAGGFGINLTSANTVVIYDLDFNPHNDAQAEDRAHRVGQTRDVRVIKLIMNNSIEERIYEMAELKLKLDHKVQSQVAGAPLIHSDSSDTIKSESKTKKDDDNDSTIDLSTQYGGEIMNYVRSQLTQK